MTRFIRAIFIGLVLCSVAGTAKSQSIAVGDRNFEDYFRRQQLLGKIDTNVSFTVRPVYPADKIKSKSILDYKAEDTWYPSGPNSVSWDAPGFFSRFTGKLLPITVQTQYNSDHPYGWNDGPMIPSKGFEHYFSAGFFAQYGPLTVQIQPEFVTAQNKDFDDFNQKHFPVTVARYYDFYNFIDLPTRFGTNPYHKFFWGQSSVRLNYKNLSFGLSTENLWWGPGMRNSLIMSNDAPGFKHLTLNTTKPIKTPIGSFEGQLIAGTLENSNFSPLTPDRYYFLTNLALPKPDSARHISGLVITWQPKWVKGLFLGFTRSSQLYVQDVHSITDWLPFFNEFKNTSVNLPVYQKKDFRSSLFARWLWPEEHAEVYFEWGHNNTSNTLKQNVLEPQDSRAYVVGFRKMVPFNSARHENLLFSVEATQLAETSVDRIRNAESWYLNRYITQGYTNQGQSLGAGIGPGGNLQSAEIAWVRGLKKIGLQIERYLHNDDFYYYAYFESQDYRRHWVDLSLALNTSWDYKHFVFNVTGQYIHSLNYQYYLDPQIEAQLNTYYVNGNTANNFRLQAGVTYKF